MTDLTDTELDALESRVGALYAMSAVDAHDTALILRSLIAEVRRWREHQQP